MRNSLKHEKHPRGIFVPARFLLAIVLVFCSVPSAHGQVSGATLSGTITDTSGAVVSNAKISVKNVDTGVIRDATSNNDGFFTAPNLLPGRYEVKVSATGFDTAVNKSITLTVGARQTLNQILHVGQVSQTVEVTGSAPTVELSSSTVSGVVDSTTIEELPLNGRDWTSLATLEPGVVSIPNQVGTGFSANKGNRGFGNQLSNGGHRANENTYRVNGISINDYSNGAPGGATGLNLGVDGIQEFSVLTSNYTAEYGRTSGAVVNAITKSGVNAFHGTGFFFDRDKIFDAKNFFDDPTKPIPSFRRIQFGASGGGAIVKDHTFIYGSYEGVRQNQPISRLIKVPSATLRAAAVPAIQPYLALWPTAPAGTPVDAAGIQTFGVAGPGIASENYYTARVDQKLSPSDNLNGSYFWDSGPQTQPDPLNNAVHQVFSRRQGVTLEETHIFSPALLNTFRAGLSRLRGDINTPVSGDPAATNAALAIAPGALATPQISVSGLTTAVGLGGLNQFLHRWTSLQLYDDAFVTRGTHSLKVGFAFERMQYNVLEKLSPNGRMNAYTSVANFLNNVTTQLNALAPGQSNEVGIRESLFAGYVQDDWKMFSNFTVNIGLRYEMTTLPTESHNRIQEITSLANCTASPTNCTAVHVNSFIASNPTTKNFEPRVGFSWDPFRNGKTAVRSGFGIFDALPLPYVFGLNTAATAPFQIIGADKNASLGSGIDNNVSFTPSRVRNRFVEQNPRRAMVLNWNFNIQQELSHNWTAFVGYVGSRSTHLSVAADDINLIQPNVTSIGLLWPLNGTRLDPNAGGTAGIRPVVFDGAATYHSFQTQLKKVMSHGFQGQVSYTFGKCRDTSSAPVTGDTYVNSIAVPLLTIKQYRVGACDFDIRHTMVGTLIWDVPAPQSSNKFVSGLTKGWELGTIAHASSGSPFTATIGGGGDPLGTGFNGDFSMAFPNILPGCDPIHGGVQYLNVNCFATPTAPLSFAPLCAAPAPLPGATSAVCPNLLGNAGRNSLYGPGLKTVDMSVFKNQKVSERLSLQLRAEAFNVLNHPNFAAPNFLNDANNSINNPLKPVTDKANLGFGTLASTSTPSRQMQFGVKVIW
ncbi:MAG: TonB-dependent receptor plug [Candidatus Angelobacter sp.]|nr:TonB-dependent receptor plug [Candidatus Angelobacter sp.]